MGVLDYLLGTSGAATAQELNAKLDGVLIPGEAVIVGFKVVRDFFCFTEKRMIIVDVQGYTGSKASYLSIPYKAVTRFQVETAGTFDLDAELKIWVSGSDVPIQKPLKKGTDVRGVQRALASGVLG